MERAVPAIMLMAASRDAAFRSRIFSSAIFWTEALEMVATLVLLGTPEPDSMLHSFLISTAAGGVLVMKLKMRDLNAASLEAAMSMIAGTARSMGVVVGE